MKISNIILKEINELIEYIMNLPLALCLSPYGEIYKRRLDILQKKLINDKQNENFKT